MNPVRGIAFKLGSVCVFTAMAVLIKATSTDVPAGEAVFFRSAFAIPVILLWLAWTRHLHDGLKTANFQGHLWRGLIGSATMALGFTALGMLPLPEVTAIGFVSPVLVTVFAAFFLGERIRLYRVGCVLLGLAGVLIMLVPRFTDLGEASSRVETIGAIVMSAAAVLRALSQIVTRRLVRTEATPVIVFYFSLICTVLALFTVPFGWVFPGIWSVVMLVGAGLLGGLGQILLTESYRNADVGVIAPFDYSSMILALLAGYFLFSELPTAAMLAGAGLVVAAGLLILYRERRLGLERGKARRTIPPQG